MKQLIEDYKEKLAAITEDYDSIPKQLSNVVARNILHTKIACYRTIISDLESLSTGVTEGEIDEHGILFNKAALLVVLHQSGSTSLLQRKMSLGYSVACDIMKQLHIAGIVGENTGTAPRKVLVKTKSELKDLLSNHSVKAAATPVLLPTVEQCMEKAFELAYSVDKKSTIHEFVEQDLELLIQFCQTGKTK